MPIHHTSGRWRLGFSLSLVTACSWGVLPIPLKIILTSVDVYTVTWFRFLLAFAIISLFLMVRRQFPTWATVQKAGVGLVAIATLFLALNYVLFLTGLDQTSPTNSQVISQLSPVFFGMGALAIFRERYTVQQWGGVGLLIFGLTLFFRDQVQVLLTASGAYMVGSGILGIAALVWAIYALAQKQLLVHLPSSSIMWLIYGGSALLFSPFIAPQSLLTLSLLQWVMLIFSGLNTLVAYGALAEALNHWEASRVSAVITLTPIVTLLTSKIVPILFPNLVPPEPMTAIGIIGALLVVGGSVNIALGKSASRVNNPKDR
jgi:drug/metabolite transporter (DMT)-like permease